MNNALSNGSFELKEQVYEPKDIDAILNTVRGTKKLKNYKNGVSYYNMALSFDTEASSWIGYSGDKCACMYAWTVGINGYVIFGRTWSDLMMVFDHISTKLHLYSKTRVIVYCHNLPYDFQWIAKRFTFTDVFAMKERKVVYAVTDTGIEFRCSYILSNYSLEKIGEQLTKYKVSKLVGDLDYSKIRHSETPMTDTEVGYCVNDSRVVLAYIQEQIEQCDGITNIPLTNTGFVRQYCRENCINTGDEHNDRAYKMLMKELSIEPDEYRLLKQAFQGGFTHANALYVGQVLDDVASFDFTSSYPTVMIADRFPMSKGKHIESMSEERFYEYLDRYCCLFNIEFTNLCKRDGVYETPLSHSKCLHIEGELVNNGRVISCDSCFTTLTDLDFLNMKDFYTWNSITVSNFWYYQRGYLPTQFVKSILKLYIDKTVLKDVDGKEVEYQHSKGQLNSSYGMTVMDVCRPEYMFDGDNETLLDSNDIDYETGVDKYNTDRKRFLFYPWGVWITAYARRRLFSGILSVGADFVYADTDSIKLVNLDEHKEYFEKYNEHIIEDLRLAMKHHGLDENLIEPKTVKGVKKPLGVWSFEGVYSRFKTLGAKRYLTEQDGKISMTVAGVNKKMCVPYLLDICGKDNTKVFDKFDFGLHVPAGYTGKNTHTYIDYETGGNVTDYLGHTAMYNEKSSIHLSESDYEMSLGKMFANYLLHIRLEE